MLILHTWIISASLVFVVFLALGRERERSWTRHVSVSLLVGALWPILAFVAFGALFYWAVRGDD